MCFNDYKSLYCNDCFLSFYFFAEKNECTEEILAAVTQYLQISTMNLMFKLAPWHDYWTQWRQLFAPVKQLPDNISGQFIVRLWTTQVPDIFQ